jgi:hypothetical protein
MRQNDVLWMQDMWSAVQCDGDILVMRHEADRVLEVATLNIEGLGWSYRERRSLLSVILFAITGSENFANRATEYADLS